MRLCHYCETEEAVVTCCGLGWCVDCWNDHDIDKHDYPEVDD